MAEDYRPSDPSRTVPPKKRTKINPKAPNVRQLKDQQRHEIRHQRKQRPTAERQAWSESVLQCVEQVAAVCGDGPVASYVALPSEPDVSGLVSAVRPGGHVLFPRVAVRKERVLEWSWGGDGFVRRQKPPRVLEPTGLAVDGVESLVSAVFVPCLALHSNGVRLGQGGGFYDTFLAGVGGDVPLIGVVFADEVRHDVAFEPHDARLTHVVCETGFRDFTRRRH